MTGPTRSRASLLRGLLVALVSLAWSGSVAAQEAWTVQTVAFRDLRDANAEVAILRSLGLPAYTEFTMAAGLQYVRVRVGCYDTRAGAEAWATLLRGAITRDAVAMPVEAVLPDGVPCIATDVGFRKPSAWSLVSTAGDLPTFRVEVGGQLAFLRHDGEAWRLWQAVAPEPAAAPAVPVDLQVRVGSIAGLPVARSVAAGALCPGRLLATAGPVAIVDGGDAVIACRVVEARP
jgi:hypothetical protein